MEEKRIQTVYLDDRVILAMLIVSLAALMITSFRYMNNEHCFPFTIRAKADFFRTDEPIRFETDAPYARYFQWDFGDEESNETKINSVIHSYNQPGEYIVALTVNGKCVEYKSILISKAPKLENPLLMPTFVCPQSAQTGSPVIFQDTTAGARSWEWRFGETASVDATSSTARYIYRTPGLKTISLVINNDPHQMGVCKVYVTDKAAADRSKETAHPRNRQPSPVIVLHEKPGVPPLSEQENTPPAKEPPKPAGVSISKEELESKLRLVVNNFLKAESFAPYLCNNLNMPVVLNGTQITFTQLCTKLSSLQNEKKIKELKAQPIKSDETNCIISLNVTLKLKKNFLGIF